jgi:acyl carrier protein
VSGTLETVGRMIREVMDGEWDADRPITASTSFNGDLELESLEFVALAEKLQGHYGDRVDFVSWLSSKDLDEIIALRVGDVVEHIDSCLTSKPTA